MHGFDGVRTYCAVCGPEACPTYKAPSRRRCARCGVRENAHASLSGADLPHLQPGVCPWWVRPAPAPLRALTSTLRRFRF